MSIIRIPTQRAKIVEQANEEKKALKMQAEELKKAAKAIIDKPVAQAALPQVFQLLATQLLHCPDGTGKELSLSAAVTAVAARALDAKSFAQPFLIHDWKAAAESEEKSSPTAEWQPHAEWSMHQETQSFITKWAATYKKQPNFIAQKKSAASISDEVANKATEKFFAHCLQPVAKMEQVVDINSVSSSWGNVSWLWGMEVGISSVGPHREGKRG